MSSTLPPTRIDKGKRRADDNVDEHTPLLLRPSSPAPRSSLLSGVADDSFPSPNSSRTLRSKLLSVFLISLCTSIFALIIIVLLAWSYASRAADISPEDALKLGLIFRGPDRIDLINATQNGLWINAHFRVGIDAGSIIGVNPNDAGKDGHLEALWKALGRWGVRRLDKVSVQLSTIHLSSKFSGAELALVDIPPLTLQLATAPPRTTSWLIPTSAPIFVKLTPESSYLVQFLQDSWEHSTIALSVAAQHARVHGGAFSEHSWRDKLSITVRPVKLDIQTDSETLHFPPSGAAPDVLLVPHLPGLPQPGSQLPSIKDFLTLTSFSVQSSDEHLSVVAEATLPNPLPSELSATSPALPFTISLGTSPNFVSVASVTSAPIYLTHPNITLSVSGSILPIPSSASHILSEFLSRFLTAQDNPISISTPILPNLTLGAVFPAPHPRPQILRNVSIHDMKVRPRGSGVVTSGTVFVRVYLPKGMHIKMDIFKVLPDVLVFDGEVPGDVPDVLWSWPWPIGRNEGGGGGGDHLPDPLPERAFGRIQPQDWLPSLSVEDDQPEAEGSVYVVTARIVDVPLEILPGRQKVFSSFVKKVSYSTNDIRQMGNNS